MKTSWSTRMVYYIRGIIICIIYELDVESLNIWPFL